ncbi:MAG: sulfatase [Actinomycetota bacterium]|nr:sulfatase [Actinomycetota bacterium]
MSKPNVFFLAIDSLRADVVFGDQVSTPNIDAFGSRGAAFHQCVCTTTTTTPSFSSMFTGCYPPRHGVRGLQGHRLASSVTTMAEAFAGAGYKTHAEVTGPLLPETGVLRGFEEANHRQAYRVPFFGWRDEIVSRMRTLVEPWFMLLHIWEVHRPYRSPPNFEKRRDRTGYEAAVAATDEYLGPVFEAAGDNALVVITGDHGEEYPDSEMGLKMIRWARRLRKGLALGKWFPYLDTKLAEHEIGHGFALYEHLVRVPLVIAGPGVPPTTVEEQVRHVDLFPTLADLCGVPIPAGIDGRSLLPLFEGRSLSEEPAYLEAVGVKLEGNRIVGVRTPDWKLLKRGGAKPALYKLDGGTPPDEKRNLYRRYPEVARRLEGVLEQIASTEAKAESGMTADEEAVVEKHLRDLGYL